MRRSLVVLAVLAACGKPAGTIAITTGPETDTFTKEPKPTRIRVEAIAKDGSAARLGEAAITSGLTLDLAEQKRDTEATVRVTARDDQGVIRAAGSSLLVELGALTDRTLFVFVQRTGELARMPCPLDAREDPLLGVVGGRFVLEAGGGKVETQLCDLLSMGSFTRPPSLPFAPLSMAPVKNAMLLVRDGAARVYDFSEGAGDLGDAQKPEGGEWQEISGGPTIEGEQGVHFIVGPARASGAPTDKVLRVSPDGKLAFERLRAPRLGAGAAWVPGRGLVVVGGSASGAGAEEIAPARELTQFPSDARAGAAAALDGSRVVFAGAGQPSLYDLQCGSGCAPAPFGADPGVPIVELHALDRDAVLAVGRAQDGETRVFRLDAQGASEIALKEPRKRARGVRLPTGALGIAGGAVTLESYAR